MKGNLSKKLSKKGQVPATSRSLGACLALRFSTTAKDPVSPRIDQQRTKSITKQIAYKHVSHLIPVCVVQISIMVMSFLCVSPTLLTKVIKDVRWIHGPPSQQTHPRRKHEHTPQEVFMAFRYLLPIPGLCCSHEHRPDRLAVFDGDAQRAVQ